mmetsp:Transcript_10929/g.30593  ORF Transcript_10929/g.30593 Transcript_10929/m.30593 type:complete len:96 (+) Transcript_10929:23-310(+)
MASEQEVSRTSKRVSFQTSECGSKDDGSERKVKVEEVFDEKVLRKLQQSFQTELDEVLASRSQDLSASVDQNNLNTPPTRFVRKYFHSNVSKSKQ